MKRAYLILSVLIFLLLGSILFTAPILSKEPAVVALRSTPTKTPEFRLDYLPIILNNTLKLTVTPTSSVIPTSTPTPTFITQTATSISSSTATYTPTRTATATASPFATSSATIIPTATPTPTATDVLLADMTVEDIFGRTLNNKHITLVDWEGHIANPIIKFFIRPPENATFPATATLSANGARLHFNRPSEIGPNGPSKTITFESASSRKPVYLSIFPDRNLEDETYHLDIQFVDNQSFESSAQINIKVIDQDQSNSAPFQISVDFSQDQTQFFNDALARDIIQQAADDWAYFIADMNLDSVSAGAEQTYLGGVDAWEDGDWVANSNAYTGFLLYAYGTNIGTGGGPSYHAFQTSNDGAEILPLRRSGGILFNINGPFDGNPEGWLFSTEDDDWWKWPAFSQDGPPYSPPDLYSIARHEVGHALFFNPGYTQFGEFKNNGLLVDPDIVAYHGNGLIIDQFDHFTGEDGLIEVDGVSRKGAFGNDWYPHFYEQDMPAGRWLITKLDLLSAQAIGYQLRNTSPFIKLSLVSDDLPTATLAEPYNVNLEAIGGIPFYNWTLESGILPDGLSLNSFTGAISGTPNELGAFDFIVKVQDYNESGSSVLAPFSITVNSASTETSTPTASPTSTPTAPLTNTPSPTSAPSPTNTPTNTPTPNVDNRYYTDNPDISEEPQVHVLYVLPSDGVDRRLDVEGVIDNSVASIQNWLSSKTNGVRLRLDVYNNDLDITFHRLSRTNSELAGFGAFIRDEIELEINQAGFNESNKVYLVYYDGVNTVTCGSSAWPPEIPGNTAVLFLQGLPDFPYPCNQNEFASNQFDPPGYWEFIFLHEVFHILGGVPNCAPNHTLAGHVSDGPTDLMHAGSEPWDPQDLDIGNDDYWNHDNAGCLDLYDSVFMVHPEDPVFNPDSYYRFTNLFLGETRALDTYDDENNGLFMGPTGDYSGQYWKITPIGNSGYYRLTNLFLGEARALDTYDDENNGLFMGPTGDYSGQYWKIFEIP